MYAELIIDDFLTSEESAGAILYHYIYRPLFEQKARPPKDPYERAKFRISTMVHRFKNDTDKVDNMTVLRVQRTTNPEKLKGIVKAAQEEGLKKAVRAAKAKLKSMGIKAA